MTHVALSACQVIQFFRCFRNEREYKSFHSPLQRREPFLCSSPLKGEDSGGGERGGLWACACHTLTSRAWHTPTTPHPCLPPQGGKGYSEGMLEGHGTHGKPGRTILAPVRFLSCGLNEEVLY